MTNQKNNPSNNICSVDDIVPNTGVCALHKNSQVAIFRIKDTCGKENFYALDNFDPFSEANILSRGIVGNMDDKVVVASPIYKQHFDLETGKCIEDDSVSLNTFKVHVQDGMVLIAN